MTTPTDVQDVASAARDLIEGRVQSVTALAEASERERALEVELSAVRTERTKLYAAALKDGWTDAELGKLGFDKPGARTRRRPSSRGGGGRARRALGAQTADGGGDAAPSDS